MGVERYIVLHIEYGTTEGVSDQLWYLQIEGTKTNYKQCSCTTPQHNALLGINVRQARLRIPICKKAGSVHAI